MQRDAILALEGRELDAMVAEALGCYDIRRHATRGLVARNPEFISERHINLPLYSTDWQAMGWLVQAMERRGYLIFGLDSGAALDGLPNWFAGFHKHQEERTGTTYAETAPLAVARAALLALCEEE